MRASSVVATSRRDGFRAVLLLLVLPLGRLAASKRHLIVNIVSADVYANLINVASTFFSVK